MHRTALNKTALVSEMPIIIDKESVIIAPRQWKTPVSLLHEDACEELAFPYLFPKDKFENNICRNVPVSAVQ